MTIQEAIEQVELFDASWGTCEQALEILVAIARAYSCERCVGTGSSIVGTSFTGRSWRERMDS